MSVVDGPDTDEPVAIGPSTHAPSTYGPSTYGDAFADVYDAWYGDVSNVTDTVRAVAGLARAAARRSGAPPRPATVLELGVGTGRLAVPMAEAGIDVVGLDASAAMLSELGRRDPTGRVRAVLGDMAAPLPGGPYDVVLAAFNTFLNLTSQSDQASCLRHAAAAVGPGGVVAIEAFVPQLGDGPAEQVELRRVGAGLVFDVSLRDALSQTVRGQQIELGPGPDRVRLRPWQIRYLGVDELDGLAASAGLVLRQRFEHWDGTPFGDHSDRHVSLYERSREGRGGT
jgi:SAM-dependent methyltransferase